MDKRGWISEETEISGVWNIAGSIREEMTRIMSPKERARIVGVGSTLRRQGWVKHEVGAVGGGWESSR